MGFTRICKFLTCDDVHAEAKGHCDVVAEKVIYILRKEWFQLKVIFYTMKFYIYRLEWELEKSSYLFNEFMVS